MKCNKIIDMYCKLDKHENIPLFISIHLMHCKKCRNLIQKMTIYDDIITFPNTNLNKDFVNNTMAKIKNIAQDNKEAPLLTKQINFIPWILSGFSILLAFILIPYSSLGLWLINNMGIGFAISFGLSCAGSISVFCAVFIAKNSYFFIKKLDLRLDRFSK